RPDRGPVPSAASLRPRAVCRGVRGGSGSGGGISASARGAHSGHQAVSLVRRIRPRRLLLRLRYLPAWLGPPRSTSCLLIPRRRFFPPSGPRSRPLGTTPPTATRF